MKIYVDGDACPVKESIIEIAAEYGFPVVIVASFAHHSYQTFADHVKTIYIDGGRDAVDFRILSMLKKQDLLITQDYGLAALALAKQVIVLHQTGFEYTDQSIDLLLATRYQQAQQRRKGQRTGKGPKPFTEKDRMTFRASLIEQLIKIQSVN